MFQKLTISSLLALVMTAPLAASDIIPTKEVGPVASQAQAGRPTSGVRYKYRVWILRKNRYNGSSWWEIYTTTYSADRAQRVVNSLERVGYRSYYDWVYERR